MRCSTPRIRSTEAALVLLLALIAPCRLAAAAFSCDLVAGWGGFLKEGRWSPLVVSIENQGQALEGKLSVEVLAGNDLLATSSSRTVSMPASFPPRSVRRFYFAAPVTVDTKAAIIRVLAAGSDGIVREIYRKEFGLQGQVVAERIAVAVSSELSLDFLAQAMEGDRGTRVVYPHPEMLPESRAGWDSVDLAVVRDTSFHRLRPAQAQAIRDWVFSGGTLVLSGGPLALQLAAEGLDELSPVVVTGLVERAGLPALGALVRAPPPSAAISLALSRPRGGARVLAAEAGVPVVAVRRLGAGSVSFLAFDAADRALEGWAGRPALWRLLAEPSAGRLRRSAEIRSPVDDPWIASLSEDPVFAFPSWTIFLSFVGAYLAVCLVLLLVPLRRNWSRARAPALLALAVAACIKGWFLFEPSVFRAGLFTVDASILETAPGDGLARLERRLAIFSTMGGSASLEVGGAGSLVEELVQPPPLPWTSGAPTGGVSAVRRYEVEAGRQSILRDVELARYSGRLFRVEEVIPFELEGSLSREGGRVEATIGNRTPFPILDALLLADGRAVRFGDVPAGAAITRSIRTDEEKRDTRDADGSPGRLFTDPGHRAFWDRVSPEVSSAGPIAVGWLDRPPTAARIVGSAEPSAARCLLVVRFR